MEEVNYNGVIPLPVIFPSFLSHILRRIKIAQIYKCITFVPLHFKHIGFEY